MGGGDLIYTLYTDPLYLFICVYMYILFVVFSPFLLFFFVDLPSYEYGQNFKAVIYNDLVDKLAEVNPQVGDRLAFLSPVVFINPAFRAKYNRFEPKYSVDFGALKNSLLWFARKEVR